MKILAAGVCVIVYMYYNVETLKASLSKAELNLTLYELYV